MQHFDVKKSQKLCPVENLYGGSTNPEYEKKGPNGLPWSGNEYVKWTRRCIKPIAEVESIEGEQIRDVYRDPRNVDSIQTSFESKGWDHKESPVVITKMPGTNIYVIKSGENRTEAAKRIGWTTLIFDEVEFQNDVSKRIAAVQFNNTNPNVPNNIETMAKNLHEALRAHDLGANPSENAKRQYVRLLYGHGNTPNDNVPESTITKVLNRANNFGINGVLNRVFNKNHLISYCKEHNIPNNGDIDETGRSSWVISDKGFRLFFYQLTKHIVSTDKNLVLGSDEKGKNLKITIRGLIDKPDQNISKMATKREAWFETLNKEVLSLIRDFIQIMVPEVVNNNITLDIMMKGFIAQNGGSNENLKVIEPIGEDIFEDYMIPLCEKLNLKYETVN